MGSDPELENRRGLEWLVTARNKCQTLMFDLLERWETPPTFRRQAALAAAFSLWRAAFLLVKEQDKPLERVDDAARRFLEHVVRTNAVAFGDDLRTRSWSSVYYVENAIWRISKLTGHQFVAYGTSPVGTVRDAWNEAFEQLDRFIHGDIIVPSE
jgi:hypothetical protein